MDPKMGHEAVLDLLKERSTTAAFTNPDPVQSWKDADGVYHFQVGEAEEDVDDV